MDRLVTTRELAHRPIVSVRDRCTPEDLPSFLGRAFGTLFGMLGRLGVRPAGPPLVIYHEFDPDRVDAEVCVPVDRDVPATGSIIARDLPAMTVANMLHVGPYEELRAAHEAVIAWIGDHGFVMAGPLQERYLSGPGDGVGPGEYRTEVEIPIVPATVAARA